MNVTLPPQYETMLEEKVTSGRYADASAVIQEALRLLDERDRLQQLRAELAIGLEQIERGETVPYTPDFMDRLKREAAEHVRLGRPIKDAVKP
jgi:antitoxin ParD1/3/4